MEDYVVIAHLPPQEETLAGEQFAQLFREAVYVARRTYPEIEWRGCFVVGPKDGLEIFSAPNPAAASNVSALLGAVSRLQARVVPLALL